MIHTPTKYNWRRDAPRLVRRFYWRMTLLPVPLAAGLVAAGLLQFGRPPQFGIWTYSAVMFGVGVLMVLWVSSFGLWEKRLVEQLQAADYKLCPRCRFVLKGHEGACNCPECGEVCDLDKTQAAWRAFRPRIAGHG